MSPRLRVVGWEVRPVVMLDDGEDLTPLPIAPLTIPVADWDTFKAGGDDRSLTRLREQVGDDG